MDRQKDSAADKLTDTDIERGGGGGGEIPRERERSWRRLTDETIEI